MIHCDNCHVDIYPQHMECPLCGATLAEPHAPETAYPRYLAGKAKFPTQKLLLFLSITTGIICIFINIFTWEQAALAWSLIVCTAMMALWSLVLMLRSKRISPGAKLLGIYIAFVIAVVVMDVSTGFLKWSTSYAIPFTTILLTMLYTVLACRGRGRYREYLGYLIAVFFISVCPIVIYLCSLSLVGWTGFVAALYSLLTVIGLWMLSERSFKQEMKKRFHY